MRPCTRRIASAEGEPSHTPDVSRRLRGALPDEPSRSSCQARSASWGVARALRRPPRGRLLRARAVRDPRRAALACGRVEVFGESGHGPAGSSSGRRGSPPAASRSSERRSAAVQLVLVERDVAAGEQAEEHQAARLGSADSGPNQRGETASVGGSLRPSQRSCARARPSTRRPWRERCRRPRRCGRRRGRGSSGRARSPRPCR